MQDQSQSVLANRPDHSADSSVAEMLRAEVCSSSQLSFLMEAHDGLSAAIAERAGFKGSGHLVCRSRARSVTVTRTKRPGANSPT